MVDNDNDTVYVLEHQDDASDLCSMINTEDLLPFCDESQSFGLENFVSFDNNMAADPSTPAAPATPAALAYPDHWNKFPTMEKVDTKYAFDMHIDPGEHQNWLYNPKLDKVFIKMNSTMNVTLSYKPMYNQGKLFLRAMLLLSCSDDMHLQVRRCANHRVSKANNDGVPVEHILRCCHPDTKYMGDENATLFGERLSIVVPLGRPTINEEGRASETVALEFLCQNSCPTGINRKSTAVVFTLENNLCEIIGKSVMPCKVCSCPKRDMEREDDSFATRKRQSNSASHGKRPSKVACLEDVKIEPNTPSPDTTDEQPFCVKPEGTAHTITLTLPHMQSVQHVLRCAYNEITGMQAKEKSNPNMYLKYSRNIESLLEASSDKN